MRLLGDSGGVASRKCPDDLTIELLPKGLGAWQDDMDTASYTHVEAPATYQ